MDRGFQVLESAPNLVVLDLSDLLCSVALAKQNVTTILNGSLKVVASFASGKVWSAIISFVHRCTVLLVSLSCALVEVLGDLPAPPPLLHIRPTHRGHQQQTDHQALQHIRPTHRG